MVNQLLHYSSKVSLLLSVLCVSYYTVQKSSNISMPPPVQLTLPAICKLALALARSRAIKSERATYLTQCTHDAQAWEYTAQLLTVWRKLI